MVIKVIIIFEMGSRPVCKPVLKNPSNGNAVLGMRRATRSMLQMHDEFIIIVTGSGTRW